MTDNAAMNLPTIAPFKSERAAKIAMTKAEKAYSAAMQAVSILRCQPVNVDSSQEWDAARATENAAFDLGSAVYAQAKRQGFYVRSWYFSDCNPTRDLIHANRD